MALVEFSTLWKKNDRNMRSHQITLYVKFVAIRTA